MGLAVLWGTVAASFTIQQLGPPIMTIIDGEELWNGEKVGDRVELLRRRVATG